MDTITGMRTFAAVIDTGSFTDAAERLGISRVLTSKYVGQLVLDDLDELESAVRQQQALPCGQLRVAAPVLFGEWYLSRIVAEYLKAQPGVFVEMVLAKRQANIVEEGFDIAVRIGNLADSSLIARNLATMRVVLCAAPDYLGRAGRPEALGGLAAHDCVLDTNIDDPEQRSGCRDVFGSTVARRCGRWCWPGRGLGSVPATWSPTTSSRGGFCRCCPHTR